MSFMDKVKGRIPKHKRRTFLGEEILVSVKTGREINDMQDMLKKADEDEMSAFWAEQFLDPDTMKPILTPEQAQNDLPLATIKELYGLFREANGIGGNDPVEQAEKN